ncbi:hypothetical protein [Absidia glauca]|uniref:Ndc10 domain-containing protein n=1 Tax=Absidia glauca TaxID=4829 RepID=A0A163MUZ6_ABSGL|nr:hypothetical protein [Absidia glauca]
MTPGKEGVVLQTEPPGQNQSAYLEFCGRFSESLTSAPGILGSQFEIKIKPPRQAQEWSYSSHWESIGKALSSPGIRSYKETHVNCGSSARMAGIVCANEDQIRCQSRWNNTRMNDVYLTSLPREMMQSMEGFPINVRSFYLARTALDPPISLCKKLFPAIDEWHDRLAAKKLSPDDPILPITAVNAFAQVIMMLRNMILPTHSSNNVCLYTLYFKPRLAIRFFFLPVLYFAPSSLRHYFFASIVILLTPLLQTNERTSERLNEQSNDRTVTLLFSRQVHLLLTITNFLPFASFLFLLTLDRLRQ